MDRVHPIKRLERLYPTLNVFAMFLSCMSLFALGFDDLRQLDTPVSLLTAAVITAVAAMLIMAMLLFHFEDCDAMGKYDGVIAWLPVILIDFAIIQFLVGLVAWYNAKAPCWSAAMMVCKLGAMIVISSLVSFHVWQTLKSAEGTINKGTENVTPGDGKAAGEK